MPLTPTELLIPRVLAIGTEPGTPNYPGSMCKTGDIITQCKTITNGRYYEHNEGHLVPDPLYFPNCFRPLEWWEMREPEQMPLYLKHGENGKVRKVSRYNVNTYWLDSVIIVEFEGGRTRNLNKYWIPCDEQESNEYQTMWNLL